MPGLDVTPAVTELDRGLGFGIFQKHNRNPEKAKIRAEYPILGSGKSNNNQRKTVSIIHDQGLWDNFTKSIGRYNSKPVIQT